MGSTRILHNAILSPQDPNNVQRRHLFVSVLRKRLGFRTELVFRTRVRVRTSGEVWAGLGWGFLLVLGLVLVVRGCLLQLRRQQGARWGGVFGERGR